MSLINDALKRAKQTQQKQAERPVHIALTPADGLAGRRGFPVWVVPILVVALFLGLWLVWSGYRGTGGGESAVSPEGGVRPLGAAQGSGGVLPAAVPAMAVPAPAVARVEVGEESGQRASSSGGVRVSTNLVLRTNATAPVPAAAAPPASSVPVSAVPGAVAPEPGLVVTAGSVAVAPLSPASAPATVVAAAKPSVAEVEWPPLRLQGVYYRRTRPSVLLNGETLFEGETLEGVRVVRIDRAGVVLEKQGQRRELVLGRR